MCGVVGVGFHAQSHGCKAGVATSVPSWTSHRRPTAFTALGAQGVAPGGNGAQLAQCDLRAQLRVVIRGRLGRPRSRNGDEAAGCGPDGAIQGGVGDFSPYAWEDRTAYLSRSNILERTTFGG